MDPYETAISILTVTPRTAEDTPGGRDAAENADECHHPWWRRALRSRAGRRVLAELNIAATAEGCLPADWAAHPLVAPDDRRPEAALPVTVSALRGALRSRAGVMFLERRGAESGGGVRPQLHLCAIDPEGLRAALMPVC